MSDFWSQRGFANPNSGTVDIGAMHDFAPGPEPIPTRENVVHDSAMPEDYAARVRALELAVHLTQRKFDGGQERVMHRARSFHAFLIGKRPYELGLSKEVYDAARKAIGLLCVDEPTDADIGEMAEAAVDAAWAVIIGEGKV